MSSQLRRINWEFWIPVSAGVAVVFWFLVIPSWQNMSGRWQAASWPSTTGRVIVSKTVESQHQERTTNVYRFRYQFVVDGKDYESDRYSFRFASGDRSTAVKKLGEGDEITVFYDPSNPNRCVIDRQSSAWWNYVVLSSLVLIPIALVLRFRTMPKSPRD